MPAIEVVFKMNVPDDVSDSEISDFLDFELNYSGSIKTTILDKFGNKEIEATDVVWTYL